MSTMPTSNGRRLTVLRGRSLAKITLSLHVLGARADGYHDLDALTVAASDPYDDIALYRQAHGTTVSVTPKGAAPTNAANNLATRAVELLRPHLPSDVPGMRVRLTKRIPIGAGLGGGSSNAATVLGMLAKHYRIPKRVVAHAAAKLGSDVPFALGGRPAFMRGRGERLEPASHVGVLHLVIATPPFGCATPAVYRAWDELGAPRSDRVLDSDLVVGGLRNDLEPAALVVAPELASFREALAAATQLPPILLGSGSSYAVIVEDADTAAAIASRVRAALRLDAVWAAATVGS